MLLEENEPVFAATDEVPLVRRQVEREYGLGALANRRRLVAPEAREAVVELVDVAPQRLGVFAGESQVVIVTLPAREHRAPWRGAGDDLDLEDLAEQPAASQRREPSATWVIVARVSAWTAPGDDPVVRR